MSEAQQRITPPGPLPPPIIGTDPESAPGIEQPVIVAGGQSLPPSLPAGTTFTSPGWGWLPPPQVGMGENEPFPTAPVNPAAVPPSVAGYVQPQFATGSATSPPAGAKIPTDGSLPAFVANTLFPQFTAAGPSPAIVLNATQAAGTGTQFPQDWIKPPFPIPTTPGTSPIPVLITQTSADWGLGAGPGGGGSAVIVSEETEPEPEAAPPVTPTTVADAPTNGRRAPPPKPPKRRKRR